METENQTINVEQKESIKLIKLKNSYNWEIKLIGEIDDMKLERLKKINAQMELDYGA